MIIMKESKTKAFNYLKGWRCGAALLSIPPELQDDEDFNIGWKDGREVSKKASAFAEKHYGVTFSTIKLRHK